jgi:hypothetical protein
MSYANARRAVLGDDDAPYVRQPGDTFYGWTDEQIAAYWAAQGVAVLTPALAATGVVQPGGSGVASYSAADVAAEQARLKQLAASDAVIAAALAALKTGAYGSDVAVRSAAADVKNDAQLVVDARAELQKAIAAGELFTDTLAPGATYIDSELRGMLSTAEWMADYISLAKGGRATNAIAAAGTLPASVLSHTYSALPANMNPGNSSSAVDPGTPAGLSMMLPTSAANGEPSPTSRYLVPALAIAGGVALFAFMPHGRRT